MRWRITCPHRKPTRSRNQLNSARSANAAASQINEGISCSRGVCSMIRACSRLASSHACATISRPLNSPNSMERRSQRCANELWVLSQRVNCCCLVFSSDMRLRRRCPFVTGWVNVLLNNSVWRNRRQTSEVPCYLVTRQTENNKAAKCGYNRRVTDYLTSSLTASASRAARTDARSAIRAT